MGFEFGFARRPYKESDNGYNDANILFFWCGRENSALCRFLGFLSDYDWVNDEIKIEVKKLHFLEPVMEKLEKNKDYNIIKKLFYFGDTFVTEYWNEMTFEQKTKLRLDFLPLTNDSNINYICVELYERFEEGYFLLDALYEAYQKMLKEKLEYVWLYRSY